MSTRGGGGRRAIAAGRLDTVHGGHPHVHEHHVGRGRGRPRRPPRAPSPASPTTSMSSVSSRIMRNPVRTSAWSSTSRTRIVTGPALGRSGSAAQTRNPPDGPRPGVHVAAEHGDAFGDAAQPVAVGRAARRPPAPSSVTSSSSRSGRNSSRATALTPAPACLSGVGQRLLHDPVGGQVDAGRQRHRLAVDLKVTGVPAARTRSTSSGSASTPGCGASCGSSAGSARTTPSRRRISVSDARPVPMT